MHRQDEATETFKLIQAAYAVLGDPQERQWSVVAAHAPLPCFPPLHHSPADRCVLPPFPRFAHRYDDHRDAILRGGTGVGGGDGTDDGVIDLFPFFSTACYTG